MRPQRDGGGSGDDGTEDGSTSSEDVDPSSTSDASGTRQRSSAQGDDRLQAPSGYGDTDRAAEPSSSGGSDATSTSDSGSATDTSSSGSAGADPSSTSDASGTRQRSSAQGDDRLQAPSGYGDTDRAAESSSADDSQPSDPSSDATGRSQSLSRTGDGRLDAPGGRHVGGTGSGFEEGEPGPDSGGDVESPPSKTGEGQQLGPAPDLQREVPEVIDESDAVDPDDPAVREQIQSYASRVEERNPELDRGDYRVRVSDGQIEFAGLTREGARSYFASQMSDDISGLDERDIQVEQSSDGTYEFAGLDRSGREKAIEQDYRERGAESVDVNLEDEHSVSGAANGRLRADKEVSVETETVADVDVDWDQPTGRIETPGDAPDLRNRDRGSMESESFQENFIETGIERETNQDVSVEKQDDGTFAVDQEGPYGQNTGQNATEAVEMEYQMMQGSGDGSRIDEARAQLVSKVDDEFPEADLGRDDVAMDATVEDGQVKVSGELTDQGRKKIARENAPLQETPLEGVTEWGAGVNWEYAEFRRGLHSEYSEIVSPVGDAWDENTPDTQQWWNDNTPDVPNVNLPSAGEILGASAVAVGAPEPASSVSGAVVGGAVLVGAGVASLVQDPDRTETDASVMASPQQSGELDVPKETFPDELALDGELHPSELPVQREPAAQGMTIDPEEATGSLFVDELATTDGAPYEVSEQEVPTEQPDVTTTLSAQQQAQQSEEKDKDEDDEDEEDEEDGTSVGFDERSIEERRREERNELARQGYEQTMYEQRQRYGEQQVDRVPGFQDERRGSYESGQDIDHQSPFANVDPSELTPYQRQILRGQQGWTGEATEESVGVSRDFPTGAHAVIGRGLSTSGAMGSDLSFESELDGMAEGTSAFQGPSSGEAWSVAGQRGDERATAEAKTKAKADVEEKQRLDDRGALRAQQPWGTPSLDMSLNTSSYNYPDSLYNRTSRPSDDVTVDQTANQFHNPEVNEFYESFGYGNGYGFQTPGRPRRPGPDERSTEETDRPGYDPYAIQFENPIASGADLLFGGLGGGGAGIGNSDSPAGDEQSFEDAETSGGVGL